MKARLTAMEAEAAKLRDGVRFGKAGAVSAASLPPTPHKLLKAIKLTHTQRTTQTQQDDAGASAAADASDPADTAADAAARAEADARSVHVSGVDYAATPGDVQAHFQGCGTVNRVTILADRFGAPKGFGYVEFLELDAVQNALLLDGTTLKGRTLRVAPKRTNVPGLKAARGGRGGGRGRGGRGGRGAPRGRGRGRGRFYSPY